MTTAIESRSARSAIRSATSAAGRATEAMPPAPARARIARLRRATTRAPSASESPPATTAAAISPWLWPTTASGRTPCARHSSASETITAHSTGWTTSTRSRPGAPGAPRSTSGSDQSVCGARAVAHSSILAANTGAVSRSSTAIPAHWEPWPGKTNTVRPGTSAVPVTRAAAGSPAASARRASGSPTATARSSSAPRAVARACATSRSRPSGAGSSSATWAAWASSAAGVRAETR